MELTREPGAIRQAQHLRYRIFRDEPGFNLPARADELDADDFDSRCDHLLVYWREQLVGCYRLLPPTRRENLADFYTASEFSLTGYSSEFCSSTVEMGRACIALEHRNGLVLATMWAGILRYVRLAAADSVLGCVSVPRATPGAARGVTARLVERDLVSGHRGRAPLLAVPHRPLGHEWVAATPGQLAAPPEVKLRALPPLMQGYLRMGAVICGNASVDPEFDVADFVMTVSLTHANARYIDRLTRAARVDHLQLPTRCG